MVGWGWMTDERVILTETRRLRSPYDPKSNVKLALRMLPRSEGDSSIVFEGVELGTAAGWYFLDGDDKGFSDLWIPKSRFISALRDSLARGARREPTVLVEEVDCKVVEMLETAWIRVKDRPPDKGLEGGSEVLLPT
jgi:hypothetical protein